MYRRRFGSYGESLAAEVGTIRASADEVSAWAVEHVRVSPGLHELAERFRPVIVSSGLPQLIRPVLEREGLDLEVRSNDAEPLPGGWRLRFRDEGPCPVCGDMCKRRSLPEGRPLVYAGDGVSDRCAAGAADRVFARGWLAGALEREGRPLRAGSRRSTTLLLPFPEPYDFELSSERFRVFGPDLANLWRRRRAPPGDRRPRGPDRRGARRGGRRSPRRGHRPGRREAPRPRVRSRARSRAWAASQPVLAEIVPRLAGFRPPLAPDPFESLVTSITAQQVSLFAAFAIRSRFVERLGVPVGRVYAFPTARAGRRGTEEELVFPGLFAAESPST